MTADWQAWGNVAAWCALTISIVNLAVSLGTTRPRWVLRPEEGSGANEGEQLGLLVVNPSPAPLIVSGLKVWPRGIGVFPDRTGNLRADASRVHDWVQGRFFLYVPPGSVAELRLNSIRPGRRAVLLFWWHRAWLLPLRVPVLLYLSRKRADQINAGWVPAAIRKVEK
jgi:hypothetical protein